MILTAWTVSCWMAGTWNGLAWGAWDYTDPSDFEEIP